MDKGKKEILDEYLDNVSKCYAMVEEWLNEKFLSSKQVEYVVYEEASGKYETKKLLVYKYKNNQYQNNQKVHEKVAHEMEYWKIDDILNILKVVIEPDIIGQAKQIKQYRGWVAHRNISKGAPPNIAPQKAYEIISRILKQLDEHPDFGTISRSV